MKSEELEEEIQDIIKLIEELTCLNVNESEFLFCYKDFKRTQNEEGIKTAQFSAPYIEEAGYFIPRELKGYIKLGKNKKENKRRMIHEISHGIYLENIPVGQKIVEYDKKIGEFERMLFGNILKTLTP